MVTPIVKAAPVVLMVTLVVSSLILLTPPQQQLGMLYLSSVLAGAFLAGRVFTHVLSMPSLVGELLTGIVFRTLLPGMVSQLPSPTVSALRSVALVAILLRAGSAINLPSLKLTLKSTLCLSVVPFLFEATTVAVMARFLLSPSIAIMLGCLVSDVSPAVTTPILISLKSRLPNSPRVVKLTSSLLAASNLNSVVAIQAFYTAFAFTFHDANVTVTVAVMLAEILGGSVIGFQLGRSTMSFLRNRPDIAPVVILAFGTTLCVLLARFNLSGAGALATLSLAIGAANPPLQYCEKASVSREETTARIGSFIKFVWDYGLQTCLFTLMGTSFDYRTMTKSVLLVGSSIIIVGVAIRFLVTCAISRGGGWDKKTSVFVALCWLPKATVQAALSTVVLEYINSNEWLKDERSSNPEWSVSANELFNMAVLCILMTAPLGAWSLTRLQNPLVINNELTELEMDSTNGKNTTGDTGLKLALTWGHTTPHDASPDVKQSNSWVA